MITNRIEQLRANLKALSLSELAELAIKVGCSRKTLERFRSGDPVHLDVVAKLDAQYEAPQSAEAA